MFDERWYPVYFTETAQLHFSRCARRVCFTSVCVCARVCWDGSGTFSTTWVLVPPSSLQATAITVATASALVKPVAIFFCAYCCTCACCIVRVCRVSSRLTRGNWRCNQSSSTRIMVVLGFVWSSCFQQKTILVALFTELYWPEFLCNLTFIYAEGNKTSYRCRLLHL